MNFIISTIKTSELTRQDLYEMDENENIEVILDIVAQETDIIMRTDIERDMPNRPKQPSEKEALRTLIHSCMQRIEGDTENAKLQRQGAE